MLAHLRSAAALLGIFTILTGVLYPLGVTAAAQVLFPAQANGSLVIAGGRVVGSRLIGQPFVRPGYFWGRPSATSPFPYNAAASGGSNLGPTNPALSISVRERLRALRVWQLANPSQAVPVDLATASGSGLDPDISPASAYFQVPRVARARKLPEPLVRELIGRHIAPRTLGILGEPRVNVLELNLALDALASGG